jgi:hypothetical protein
MAEPDTLDGSGVIHIHWAETLSGSLFTLTYYHTFDLGLKKDPNATVSNPNATDSNLLELATPCL